MRFYLKYAGGYLIIFALLNFTNVAFTQSVQMDIDGAIKVHHEGEIFADPGTIRWSECDHEVWNGTDWVSLTNGKEIDRTNLGIDGYFELAAMKTDSEDNLIIAGKVSSIGYLTATDSLTSIGGQDIFIAKYSESGELLWGANYGGTGYDYCRDVILDQNDNIYITGDFRDTIHFESDILVPTDNKSDAFIAKFDKAGNYLWSKQISGVNELKGHSLATDSGDNIYVAGEFHQTIQFGASVTTSNGYGDVFLAKFDQNGLLNWFQTGGGKRSETKVVLHCDIDNNIYLCGNFSDTVYFDTDTLIPPAVSVFLIKYDHDNGNLIQSSFFGDEGSSTRVESIISDSAKDLFLTGSFTNKIYFGNDSVVSRGYSDAYLAKVSPQGILTSVKGFGFSGESISISSNDEILIAGTFSDTLFLEGNGYLIPKSEIEHFLVKYDSNGNVLQAKQLYPDPEVFDLFVYYIATTINNSGYFYVGGVNGSRESINLGVSQLPNRLAFIFKEPF